MILINEIGLKLKEELKKCSIIGTKINIITCQEAVEKIVEWSRVFESRYVCLANAHMVMEAYDSKSFWKVVNEADLITPDGMSIVWSLRILGVKNQEQICGRDLTLSLCEEAATRKIPIGFYGSSKEVVEALVLRLRWRYPDLEIVYVYSPPYRELNGAEEEHIMQEIQASGAKILFVGLGCPKQEYWMAKHKNNFSGVMVGIGAAFDFLSGFKPSPPSWIQSLGLEWLFRLSKEPRRLWYRNFWYSPRFVILFALQVLQAKILSNLD
jgi:N-acetylglucosaminyldiphosphoundecaprenol N-acetyl-beta-D-mannosaminyltransferase